MTREAWELELGPHYVNVYDYGRAYGGPEEGGWWYDTGTPIESHRWNTLVYAIRHANELRDGEYAHTGRSSSVLGGDDYIVRIEKHPARSFPRERPHYE